MKFNSYSRTQRTIANKFPALYKFIVIPLLIALSCTNQQERFATSFDGSKINYSVEGKGKPALVFIHGGLGCDKEIWTEQTSHFRKKYEVVTVSLAGHGKSDSYRTNYSMESYGKDVAAVVDKLKLDKVILIGHSMGGLVCIEAALNLQDKVIGIIGLDCLNEFEKKWSEEEIKDFLDWFRTDTKKRIYDYVRFGMFRKDVDSMLIERYALDIASVTPNVFFSELENWLNYQNEKFLGSVVNISVPISCIQNGDNVVTVETNKRYNPQYQGVRMDSLLHMFIVAYPDPVNREIEKMISYIANR